MKWTQEYLDSLNLKQDAYRKDKEVKKDFQNWFRVYIKPISANCAWKGRRFKSAKYTAFDEHLTYLLPESVGEIPVKIFLKFTFGFSNIGSDVDNAIKQTQDIVSRKYGFNDSRVWGFVATKEKVKVGYEFIQVAVLDYEKCEKVIGLINN